MSIERITTTKLWCDMDDCLEHINWTAYLSKAQAERLAYRWNGWRKDKLGRNVCPKHPKGTKR